MAVELEMDGKVLLVKGGAAVETPLQGEYSLDEANNVITFKGDKLTKRLSFDVDGEDIVNLKCETLGVDSPEPIEDAAYFDCSDNELTLVGGSIVDEKPFDRMDILKNDETGIDAEIYYGEQVVRCTADWVNDILTNIAIFVDGVQLTPSEDGSVTLSPYAEDLLLCMGGDLFSDLPDRIHIASDTEVHITYGDDTWAWTWEKTENGVKNVRKTKL